MHTPGRDPSASPLGARTVALHGVPAPSPYRAPHFTPLAAPIGESFARSYCAATPTPPLHSLGMAWLIVQSIRVKAVDQGGGGKGSSTAGGQSMQVRVEIGPLCGNAPRIDVRKPSKRGGACSESRVKCHNQAVWQDLACRAATSLRAFRCSQLSRFWRVRPATQI